MSHLTLIQNADWVITWDESTHSHGYLRNADVAFRDDTIVHIGKSYHEKPDHVIDGRDLMVMPGLVDIHSHPSVEPSWRGIREEHGVPEMYMTALYERSVAYGKDAEGERACTEVAYCELLLSGVTSIADLSQAYPGWVDLVAKSGIRGFLAPGYASARWTIRGSHLLDYIWDEKSGLEAFDRALQLIDKLPSHPSGRLSGIVYPAQIDTCTESLLRDSAAAARERGIPFTTHCAQSVPEFQEMVRRHGITPIQWAEKIGILGESTTLGHAIFIDEHSWLHWWSHRDIDILSRSRTNVAHCPSPFARYGQTLEDFGRYRRAGVNIGLGTDVSPHNLIEEMRLAAILARVSAGDITTVQTADLFHAATVGGATALMRKDIGRLAPGMKADLVLVDLKNAFMQPARDPLRSLVYTAADRAVRDVFVDGIQVVKSGRVLTLDHADALARVTEAQARMEKEAPNRDGLGRSSIEISPLSLRLLS
jgi:5-methylthioadenosine/S-adenosylhomocysteine deaminase